jgi:hypothetical protein
VIGQRARNNIAMKNTQRKKLSLNTEIVRALDARQLRHVAGGLTNFACSLDPTQRPTICHCGPVEQ